MRASSVMAIICFLLLLAVALMPWLVTSCVSPSLMPEDLRLEKVHYEATVDAVRTLTMVAQRAEDSTLNVVVVGTVRVGQSDQPSVSTESHTPTPSALPPRPSEAPSTVTPTATPTERPTSVVKVRTATLGPAPSAASVVVIRPEPATLPPKATPSSTGTAFVPGSSPQPSLAALTPRPATVCPATAAPSAPTPPRPLNMVDTQDVITDVMLSDQAQQDGANDVVKGLIITLQPDGISAVGRATVFPGISRPIEMRGTFAVEEDRLVTHISSILFDGRDVTEQYRAGLEERVNWSLYKLLPQRFVGSYRLSFGQVTVYSQVRRQ